MTPVRSIALGVAALVVTGAATAADTSMSSMSSMKSSSSMTMNRPAKISAADAKLIANAMSAAPADVAKNATIAVPDAKGGMRTLRQGSNGFTCMPDDPSTPGNDPMCADQASMAWADAMMKHKAPPAGHVGLMYMLMGGTDPSNTDPFATKPANGHWIKTGPHLMIVGADAAFYAAYPKGPDPDTKNPYVMWAGTPYQHLMVPVK